MDDSTFASRKSSLRDFVWYIQVQIKKKWYREKVVALQIITDFENFTLDFKQLGFCASPVFFQTPELDFQVKYKMYFYLKRGLWSFTEQQSSSFSP